MQRIFDSFLFLGIEYIDVRVTNISKPGHSVALRFLNLIDIEYEPLFDGKEIKQKFFSP